MGIATRNLESQRFEAVVGDASNKTLDHQLGREPQTVILTPLASGVDPYLVSKSDTQVVVEGASGTFDVTVIQ